MSGRDETAQTRHKAHDDIEFLASSWHRLDVLEALADGPRNRTELKERTDVSRVTLSRILSDLEEREWIIRDAGQFAATTRGKIVAQQVAGLLETMITTDELGDALEWLPVEEFDFDLEHLRDAAVILPDATDLNAPTQDIVDLFDRSNRFRCIANATNREGLAALRDVVVAGDLAVEYILTPGVLETIGEVPELRDLVSELCEADGTDIYRYVGETPVTMVAIADDQTIVCGHGEDGVPAGTIATGNEAIHDWAEKYVDECRAEARPLEPEALVP